MLLCQPGTGTCPLVAAELNAAALKSPHFYAMFYCLVTTYFQFILISSPERHYSFLLTWHCCLILPYPSSSVALMKCCGARASWLAHCVTAGTAILGHLEEEVNSLMVLRRSQITCNAKSGQRVAEGQCIMVAGVKVQ